MRKQKKTDGDKVTEKYQSIYAKGQQKVYSKCLTQPVEMEKDRKKHILYILYLAPKKLTLGNPKSIEA